MAQTPTEKKVNKDGWQQWALSLGLEPGATLFLAKALKGGVKPNTIIPPPPPIKRP